MKSLTLIFLSLAALSAPMLHAERPGHDDSEPKSPPAENKARPSEEEPAPHTPDLTDYIQSQPLVAKDGPMILTDALMLSVPQEKLLPLLPDLRDPKRIDAAQAKLLEMVAHKEATLIDWLQTTTRDGESALAEQIVELRYPIEFEPPKQNDLPAAQAAAEASAKIKPETGPLATIAPPPGFVASDPTTFETKNTGSTLQAETVLGADGKTVTLRAYVQAVQLLRFQQYPGTRTAIPQPLFNTEKSLSILTLPDGARHLFYVGHPNLPEGRMDIFIVGVKILPGGK